MATIHAISSSEASICVVGWQVGFFLGRGLPKLERIPTNGQREKPVMLYTFIQRFAFSEKAIPQFSQSRSAPLCKVIIFDDTDDFLRL